MGSVVSRIDDRGGVWRLGEEIPVRVPTCSWFVGREGEIPGLGYLSPTHKVSSNGLNPALSSDVRLRGKER